MYAKEYMNPRSRVYGLALAAKSYWLGEECKGRQQTKLQARGDEVEQVSLEQNPVFDGLKSTDSRAVFGTGIRLLKTWPRRSQAGPDLGKDSRCGKRSLIAIVSLCLRRT